MRLFQALYSLYVALLFIVLITLVVPVYILAMPFPPKTAMKIMFNGNWAVMRLWSLLSLIGVRIEGLHNRQPDKAYICVGNHCNMLDMPVCAIGFRQPARPLAKMEFARMPVLGFLFKRFSVMVARDSAESRRKSALIMNELLRSGESILIFPEGTRNKTKEPLQPFKDGAFRSAIATQAPILPFVQINMRSCQDFGTVFFRPGQTIIRFLPPIDTTGLTENDIPALRNQVRDLIEAELLRDDPNFAAKPANPSSTPTLQS